MKPSLRASSPPTVGASLRDAARELASASPTPRLDAEVLLMHVCGLDRASLVTQSEATLTESQQRSLSACLERRRHGVPVAHLTGRREFWSLELRVSPDTLIPRPETELLVEKALEYIPVEGAWTIADLGTGSGAIALALATERPRARVIATDISEAALAIARANAVQLGVTNIEFRAGDWFAPLQGERFDLIVSNPPYVRKGDPHLSQGDVRFEPVAALVSGADGLDAIRHLGVHARDFLRPGGLLLFEHGPDQAQAVAAILREKGYRDIVCYPDLAGHARATACRR